MAFITKAGFLLKSLSSNT